MTSSEGHEFYCNVPLANCRWYNETRRDLQREHPDDCTEDEDVGSGIPMLEKFYLNEITMGTIGCILNVFLLSFLIHMYRRNRLDAIRHAPLVMALVINDIITGVVITSCAIALVTIDGGEGSPVQTWLISLRNTIVVTPAGPCICYITIALSQCLALAKPFFYEVHLTPGLFRFISILAMALGIGIWAGILAIRHMVDKAIKAHVMGQDPKEALFWINFEYGVTVGFLVIFLTLTLCTFTMVSCVLWRRAVWKRSKHGQLFRLLRMEVCVYCVGAAVVTGCCILYYTITAKVVASQDEDCAELYLIFLRGFNFMLTTTIVQYAAIQVWLLRIIIEPLIHLFCNRNIRNHLLITIGWRKDTTRCQSLYTTVGQTKSSECRLARSRNSSALSVNEQGKIIDNRLMTIDKRITPFLREGDEMTRSQLLHIPNKQRERWSISSC